MQANATLTTAQAMLPLRTRHRQEMNCQIVHDSLHCREGWTLTYGLTNGLNRRVTRGSRAPSLEPTRPLATVSEPLHGGTGQL
jgi:hypothetical protein